MKAHEIVNELVEQNNLTSVIQPLVCATLEIVDESRGLSPESLRDKLQYLKEADGWALYSDHLHDGAPLNERHDLLEAEWYSNGITTLVYYNSGEGQYDFLQLRQQSGDTHLMQRYTLYSRSGRPMHYNLWWQAQNTLDAHIGPIAQQFVGYSDTEGFEND